MKNSKVTNEVGQNINISEDRLISDCHIWLWNTYPKLRYCCWHIANERKTTKIQGSILKAKGVVSGVPDYVVNINSKTIYFEFKTATGVISENQKKCHEALRKQGFDVYIIRDFETFKNVLMLHNIQNII